MSKDEVNYYYLDPDINEDYNQQKGSYEDDNVTIVKHDSDLQTRKMAAESVDSAERKEDVTPEYKEIGQFLYMDVGRWGGDKDTGDAWTRRRNFGLVCGSGAILCNYDDPFCSYYNPDTHENFKWVNEDPEVTEHPDIGKMKTILTKLSISNILGPVTVVKALVCADEIAEAPSSDEILVFLGDLHAPVMNCSDRTCLQGPYDREPPRTRGRIMISENIKKFEDMCDLLVPFFHNLYELGPEPEKTKITALLTALLKDILGSSFESQQFKNCDDNEKITVESVIDSLKFNEETIVEDVIYVLKILVLHHKSCQLKNWTDDEKTTEKDAEDWFGHYHGDEEKKGGDIFQNAGGDLCEFLALLLDYQKQGSTPSAKLIQLGDLYDFWLGLKLAFKTMQPPKMFLDPDTQSFLDFWRNETLHHTSEPTRKAIKLLHDLNPEFVYGNHDGYRATSLWKDVPEKKVSENFVTQGIWAEHGHQSDVFNQDSNAVIGWAFTQLGLIIPESRNWEVDLREFEIWLFKNLCKRLICIRHAAEQCQNENKRVYVMGHTHEPLLKKVHVVEQDQEKSQPI